MNRLDHWLGLISTRIRSVLADPDVGRADLAAWYETLSKRRIRAARIQRRRCAHRRTAI